MSLNGRTVLRGQPAETTMKKFLLRKVVFFLENWMINISLSKKTLLRRQFCIGVNNHLRRGVSSGYRHGRSGDLSMLLIRF